jgi:hypothetical protein
MYFAKGGPFPWVVVSFWAFGVLIMLSSKAWGPRLIAGGLLLLGIIFESIRQRRFDMKNKQQSLRKN